MAHQLPGFPAFDRPYARFVVLGAIVGLALLLRIYFFAGYIGLDDGEYARFAYELANGQFRFGEYEGPAVFPLRWAVFYPPSLLVAMLGLGEWSIALYPLALSIAGLLMCYLCAATLFDRKIGLIAATLYAMNPLDVREATRLLPDLPAAVYASAGIVVLLLLIRKSIYRSREVLMAGVLAGILFGLSWLCKETVAFFVLTCAALLFIYTRRQPKMGLQLWLAVGAGSLFVLVAEAATYAIVAGDWLYRFHEIERNYQQWPNSFFTEGSNFGWAEGSSRAVALVKRLFISGPKHVLLNGDFLYMPLVAFLGCARAIYARDREFILPAVWLISLVLMFNFASSSVSSYSPLPLFNRYYYPILFPSVVVAAALIGKLIFGAKGKRDEQGAESLFWGSVVASAIALIAADSFYRFNRPPLTWTPEVRRMRDMVAPSTTLYADTLALRAMNFFHGFPSETAWVDFQDVDDSTDMPRGSLVFVDSAYLDWLNVNVGMWLNNTTGYRDHDFYRIAPSTWQKLLETDNAVLYEVQ